MTAQSKQSRTSIGDRSLTIRLYVTSARGTPTCSSSDTLGAVLTNLTRSHQVVFVLDKDNTFIGLVSPQQTFFKHRYPARTLVKNSFFSAPKLTPNSTLKTVAKIMASTKIYTLPVFSKNKQLSGVITDQGLLQAVTQHKQLLNRVERIVTIKKPVMASSTDPVKKIHALYKKHLISRVVLITDTGSLDGIITKSDILPVFTRPDQQRTRTGTLHRSLPHLRIREKTYDQERSLSRNEPIRIYMTKKVATVDKIAPLKLSLEKMLSQNVGSVVYVSGSKPIGIVTRSDIIRAIAAGGDGFFPNIVFESSATNLKEQFYEQLSRNFVQQFAEKMVKRVPLVSMKVSFKLTKNPTGLAKLCEAHLNIRTTRKDYFAQATERRIDQAVASALLNCERIIGEYISKRRRR